MALCMPVCGKSAIEKSTIGRSTIEKSTSIGKSAITSCLYSVRFLNSYEPGAQEKVPYTVSALNGVQCRFIRSQFNRVYCVPPAAIQTLYCIEMQYIQLSSIFSTKIKYEINNLVLTDYVVEDIIQHLLFIFKSPICTHL